MKNTALILEGNDYLDEFFDGGRLFGIRTDTPAYRLCSLLNQQFDFKFRASPENLLQKQYGNDPGPGSMDLFSSIEAYFSVYINEMPPCITRMILYTNRHEDCFLVDDLNSYDYLLLIFNAEMLLYRDDILSVLSASREIGTIEELDITGVSEIENLSL